ncbi:MAG: hypothetical protein RLY71_781 [Pseudomonadota bacterium]|jgi:hypothetical protein
MHFVRDESGALESMPDQLRASAESLLSRAIATGKLKGSSSGIELLGANGRLSRPFRFKVFDVSTHAVLVQRRRVIQTRLSRTPFMDYHIICRRGHGVMVTTVPRSIAMLYSKQFAGVGEVIEAIRRHISVVRRREKSALEGKARTEPASPVAALRPPRTVLGTG